MKKFQLIQEQPAVNALVDALSSPNEIVRDIGVIGLQKLPATLVTDDIFNAVEHLIETETPTTRAFSDAVQTLGVWGQTRAVPFLCNLLQELGWTDVARVIVETLSEIGDPQIIPTVLETCHISTWRYLARPEFLCELVKYQDQMEAVLCSLCFDYNIRVMPDSFVMLSDGQQLSCKDTVWWLKVRS